MNKPRLILFVLAAALLCCALVTACADNDVARVRKRPDSIDLNDRDRLRACDHSSVASS